MNKQLVPELRFPEFSGEWEEKKLGEVAEINKSSKIPEEFYYIDLESVNQGRLNTNIKKHNKNNAPSRAKRVLANNDILYSTVRPYQKNNLYIDFEFNIPIVASTGFAQIKPIIGSNFLYNYLYNHRFTNEVLKRCTGTSYPAINTSDLSRVLIPHPQEKLEQEKIGKFFYSIDKKLELQEKKIANLKEYKKAMMQRIFSQEIRFKDEDGKEYPEWEEKKLGNLCNITTGKLDANAMVENGEYRFYTCAKDFFRIDKYKFDTEALLISGNGANVGYIHYYNGKFNAYQRTYVLDEFAEDIIFIKWYLEQHLKKRIFEDKNEGSTPYITLSTLSEMSIILPIKQEQEKIANFLSSLDKKIQLEEEKLENYKDYKKGLMQRMFI